MFLEKKINYEQWRKIYSPISCSWLCHIPNLPFAEITFSTLHATNKSLGMAAQKLRRNLRSQIIFIYSKSCHSAFPSAINLLWHSLKVWYLIELHAFMFLDLTCFSSCFHFTCDAVNRAQSIIAISTEWGWRRGWRRLYVRCILQGFISVVILK